MSILNFIFFSIASDFKSFHRKREIEAVIKVGDVKAVYYKPPESFLKGLRRIFSFRKDEQEFDNLKILSLYVLIPMTWALKSKALMCLFVELPIKLQVSYARRNYLNTKDVISWFYKPNQYLYLKNLKPYIYLHYDNYKDDISYKFSSSEQFDKTLIDCISNSLFTLVSSSKLYETYKTIRSNGIYYYPNAISRELIPSNVDKLNKQNVSKVIGFVGQLDNSLDVELVKKISKAFKGYSIRLIGGYSKVVFEALDGCENVELLGYMKYELLGEEIKNFSIGICPYKDNSFNKFRNPLKITEYYSYGLPVVSVNCDIDDKAKEFMGIANTHDEFIKSIKTQLAENTLSKNIQRRKYAEKNCWDNRISFLMNKISDNKTQ
ncbi:glycosyltransferase [Pseudoalteromonas sp. NCIMB_1079]|uniref:glycosyltransferase n=1 Tax=Pseudoalteromonas sp. NCIMB 1079 TaxID=3142847 RepID=UPI00339C034A